MRFAGNSERPWYIMNESACMFIDELLDYSLITTHRDPLIRNVTALIIAHAVVSFGDGRTRIHCLLSKDQMDYLYQKTGDDKYYAYGNFSDSLAVSHPDRHHPTEFDSVFHDIKPHQRFDPCIIEVCTGTIFRLNRIKS